MNNRPKTSTEMEAYWLLAHRESCLLARARFDTDCFLQELEKGNFIIETDLGIYIVRLPRREVIPFSDKPRIPSGTKHAIKRNRFSVSTNMEFQQVLVECAKPRKGGTKNRWIREKLKYLLQELNEKGSAHSIEIWHEGCLVGGALGVQTGAVYVSLSVYSHHDGAGNAAFIELHHRLQQAGFVMHDSILPSNLSRFFGGRTISSQEDLLLRQLAVTKNLEFPLEPAILPAHNFGACIL